MRGASTPKTGDVARKKPDEETEKRPGSGIDRGKLLRREEWIVPGEGSSKVTCGKV